MLTLAGDIGGTKTFLRLAITEDGKQRTLAEAEYISRDYPDLAPMVQEFLSSTDHSNPDSACFAVAGPVREQRAKVTYLPWQLDARQLEKELAIPRVELINDFQGVGYGIEALSENDLVTLQVGRPELHGTRALLGAGTGLGGGILVWQGDRYQMIASEIGHSDFSPRNEKEMALMHYMLQSHKRVSCEHIISGKGLVAIFSFLQQHTGKPINPELQQQIHTGDAAAAISEFALTQQDELASEALEMFIQLYGAEAGNLALTCKASGGVYIAGGIAPKIIKTMRSPSFIDAFTNKAPMRELLAEMPVHVVVNPKVGLLGAMVKAVTSY
jgi:glucokinase